jgi:hypothetical protein
MTKGRNVGRNSLRHLLREVSSVLERPFDIRFFNLSSVICHSPGTGARTNRRVSAEDRCRLHPA